MLRDSLEEGRWQPQAVLALDRPDRRDRLGLTPQTVLAEGDLFRLTTAACRCLLMVKSSLTLHLATPAMTQTRAMDASLEPQLLGPSAVAVLRK